MKSEWVAGFVSESMAGFIGIRSLMRGGEWSFSLYMWHAMIIFIANQMFGMIGGTGAWAIATNALFVLGIAIIFSGVSYAVIEKPFLEMRKKYSK